MIAGRFSRLIFDYVFLYFSGYNVYVYVYIETQKKHIRLNVSAKAFISMTFQNPTEHT